MLTGVWSAGGEAGEAEGAIPIQASISYLATIEPAPDLVFVTDPAGIASGVALVIDTATGELTGPEFLSSAAEREPFCGPGGGSAANPNAEPGYACVFSNHEVVGEIGPADLGTLESGGASELWQSPDPESGVIVPFSLDVPALGIEDSPGGYVRGSWALNTE